jgi:diguanylate cyclase (GGDEF)-like protein
MQRLAMSDALTGLANRRAIMVALEAAIAAAEAEAPLAVLLCDIDHFKRINDGFGHIAGDEVLVAFGRRLGAAVRAPEAVGRCGGEEFLLLLPGDPDALGERVSPIRSAITDAPYVFGEAERTVTASGGLAFLRAGDTAVSLIERADVALYKAKENGRNRIEEERSETGEQRPEEQEAGDQEAGAAGSGRRGWRDGSPGGSGGGAGRRGGSRAGLRDPRPARLRRLSRTRAGPVPGTARPGARPAGGPGPRGVPAALPAGRRRGPGLVTSCEALLRWQSSSRGNVAPVDFIPFAEEAGLMTGIGDWVLQDACREAAGWRDGPKVCVNLSPVQFRLPDLVERVAGALAGAGLPPGRLELEITETAMIDDVAAAARMLHGIRAMGVTIALDDFGTGCSSLSFLRALPFDRVKIDRSLVQDLGVRPGAVAIVRAVVELCRGLGVATTAEGVETDRQIELLRAAGCVELQGYRIGLPRPPSGMPGWRAIAAGRHAGEMELIR